MEVIHEVGGYSVIYSKYDCAYYVKHNGKYVHKPKAYAVQQTLLEFYTRDSAVKYVEQLLANN